MNNWFLWFFIALWLVGPLVYSAGTLRNLFLGWRIPTTWVSALPGQGWVEVIGKVKGDPIQSQIKKSECAYWQLEIKEYKSGGRGGGRWQTVHKTSSGPFTVDDMTGRIKILEGGADMVLGDDPAVENLDQPTKTILENLGVKTKGILGFDKRLRLYERTLAPEEEILVLGRIQRIEGQISISGGAIVPQVISNLNKAQTLKALFWRGVRPMILPYAIGIVFIAFYFYSLLR